MSPEPGLWKVLVWKQLPRLEWGSFLGALSRVLLGVTVRSTMVG